jgi:hypothetical protein
MAGWIGAICRGNSSPTTLRGYRSRMSPSQDCALARKFVTDWWISKAGRSTLNGLSQNNSLKFPALAIGQQMHSVIEMACRIYRRVIRGSRRKISIKTIVRGGWLVLEPCNHGVPALLMHGNGQTWRVLEWQHQACESDRLEVYCPG